MCPEPITTIIGVLPTALSLLKKGIDLSLGRKKKFKLEIGEYQYEENYPVLAAYATITNLSNDTYTIDSVALWINDSIKVEHSLITQVSVATENQYVIDFNNDGITFADVEFAYPHPMQYKPQLAKNEQAYGLVLFDFRDYKAIPIQSLKISVSLAGHPGEISQQLK